MRGVGQSKRRSSDLDCANIIAVARLTANRRVGTSGFRAPDHAIAIGVGSGVSEMAKRARAASRTSCASSSSTAVEPPPWCTSASVCASGHADRTPPHPLVDPRALEISQPADNLRRRGDAGHRGMSPGAVTAPSATARAPAASTVLGDDGVDEERTDAAPVRVARVDDHRFWRAQRRHRSARRRATTSGSPGFPGGLSGAPHSAAPARPPDVAVRDGEHHAALGVVLERAVAVSKPAVAGRRLVGMFPAPASSTRTAWDGLGHLLRLGATFWIGVAPTRPGMPSDTRSQQGARVTVSATSASQGSPARRSSCPRPH